MLFTLLAPSLLHATLTYAFEGLPDSARKCSGCHTLTKEEATGILKAQAVDVRNAPVSGLWEVEGLQNGKKFIVYVDYSKEYIVLINRFLSVDEVGKPPSLKKLDISKIPLDNAVIMGDPEAENKIIVFDDVECPYCKKLHVEIKKVLEKRKDIAFMIKLYPLDIHPTAYEKSKAIQCEKSLEMLDDAFAGKEIPKPACETNEIDENIKLARSLGITGTPAIIFPDGRLLPGFVEADMLLQLLENREAGGPEESERSEESKE